MGTVKDRNGLDLTEAEDIKKRWQEYLALYEIDLNGPDSQDGVNTHLEPGILESKDKFVLGTINMNKTNVGDGIPA